MSDDDDTPPSDIIDLNQFARRRATRREKKWHAALDDDGALLLRAGDTGPDWRFGGPALEWLGKWVQQAKLAIHSRKIRDEHRCWRCGKVKWIECRGHEERTLRQHYRLEVTEERIVYVGNPPRPQTRPYRARTACERLVSGGRTESKWDNVTCINCLKRRPRAVE